MVNTDFKGKLLKYSTTKYLWEYYLKVDTRKTKTKTQWFLTVIQLDRDGKRGRKSKTKEKEVVQCEKKVGASKDKKMKT